MQLQEDDIREFLAIWKEEFNEDLSEGEARRQATLLLKLYSILAQPSNRPRKPEKGDLGNAPTRT